MHHGVVGSRAAKKAMQQGSDSSLEAFCREALDKGTITHAVVERALGMAHVPKTANRKNVIPKGEDAGPITKAPTPILGGN